MTPDCKICPTPCVEKLKNGKTTVHGREVLSCKYADKLPEGDLNSIMKELWDQLIFASESLGLVKPGDSTKNNVRGIWARQIFGSICWNVCASNIFVVNSCIVLLPSISGFDFKKIFESDTANALSDLSEDLSKKGMELSMSNPDFICVSDIGPDDAIGFRRPISNLSKETQSQLSSAYKVLESKCAFNSLRFGISLKTSYRSDRRYLVAYEGNVFKVLFAHLQIRYWDREFRPSYYSVVVGRLNKTDRKVLSVPATHTILNLHSPPTRSVDNIFNVKTTSEMQSCIEQMVRDSFHLTQ